MQDLRRPRRLNSVQTFVLQQYRGSDAAGQEQKSTMDGHRERQADRGRRMAAANAARVASNYHQLQRDLAERARLYELDTGAEVVLSPQEMSRRAAARAGLEMPRLNPDLEDE